MSAQHRKLIRHTLIYGTGEILNKGLAFLLIPVYSRVFAPDAYGILQLLVITGTLISIVSQLGMGSTLFRLTSAKPAAEHAALYRLATGTVFAASLALAAMLLMLAPLYETFLTGQGADRSTLILLLLTAIFRNLTIIPTAKLRIEERPVQYTLYNVSRFAAHLILTIAAVLVLKMGINGVIAADLTVQTAWALIGIVILKKDLFSRQGRQSLAEVLHFGLPLVPAALALYALNMADRYLLKALSTADSVGLYAMGYRLGMVMAVAVGAFQQSWAGTMFKVANGPDPEKTFQRLFNGFSALLMFLTLGLSLFAGEILQLLSTEAYYPSAGIVPWIAGGYYFLGLFYFTAIGIHQQRKTQWQALTVTISALINIGLNLIMIPRWGMHGAAAATLVSFAVMGLAATAVSQKLYPLPYQWGRNSVLGITVVLAITGMGLLPPWPLLIHLIIKLAVLCLFLILAAKVHHWPLTPTLFFKQWRKQA